MSQNQMADLPPVPQRSSSLSKWPHVNLEPNSQNKVSVQRGLLVSGGVTARDYGGENYPPPKAERQRRPLKPRAIVTPGDSAPAVATQAVPAVLTDKGRNADGEHYYSPPDDDTEVLEEATKLQLPVAASEVTTTRCAEVQTDPMNVCSIGVQHLEQRDIADAAVSARTTRPETCTTSTCMHTDPLQEAADRPAALHAGVQTDHHPAQSLQQSSPGDGWEHTGVPTVPSVSSVDGSEGLQHSLRGLHQVNNFLPEHTVVSQRSASPSDGDSSSRDTNFSSQASVNSASSAQGPEVHVHHYHYYHNYHYHGPQTTHNHNYTSCTINQRVHEGADN